MYLPQASLRSCRSRAQNSRGHGLSQAVIYIVEGVYIYVPLALPCAAGGVESKLFLGLEPGHVHALELQPALVALGGAELGVLVALVLEMVYQGARRG